MYLTTEDTVPYQEYLNHYNLNFLYQAFLQSRITNLTCSIFVLLYSELDFILSSSISFCMLDFASFSSVVNPMILPFIGVDLKLVYLK